MRNRASRARNKQHARTRIFSRICAARAHIALARCAADSASTHIIACKRAASAQFGTHGA